MNDSPPLTAAGRFIRTRDDQSGFCFFQVTFLSVVANAVRIVACIALTAVAFVWVLILSVLLIGLGFSRPLFLPYAVEYVFGAILCRRSFYMMPFTVRLLGLVGWVVEKISRFKIGGELWYLHLPVPPVSVYASPELTRSGKRVMFPEGKFLSNNTIYTMSAIVG